MQSQLSFRCNQVRFPAAAFISVEARIKRDAGVQLARFRLSLSEGNDLDQQTAPWPRLQARGFTSSSQRTSRRALVVTNAVDFSVRPYTLRKGDTLDTIAKKRSLTTDQILGVNPELNPAKLEEGSTILLPAGRLSSRDREILAGIGVAYRLYPVREGETLSEIMSKRRITLTEMQTLNPGVNLDKVEANQVLKLPANKFTVREREMLMSIVPHEFFEATKNPFVIGIGALLMVCGFVLAWMRFHRDELDETA